MGLGKKIGGWFGVTSKGKSLSESERATEDSIQQAIDKLSTGSKAFGNRSLSAKDAEAQLRAQGVLPQGWRLRESGSTSSGYRPTQAASKKMGALHAGMVGAAALTGGAALGVGGLSGLSGLASAGIQGGLGAAQGGAQGGLKGALIGGGLGAATGGLAPGAGGAASSLGKQVAIQAGLGAAGGLAGGGGWKGALRGGAVGAAGALAPKVAPAITKSGLAQKGINVGLNAGLNTAATGRFDPTSTAVSAGSAFLPSATGKLTGNSAGQRALNLAGNAGINLAASRFAGGGAGGGTGGGGNVVSTNNNYYNSVMPQQSGGAAPWWAGAPTDTGGTGGGGWGGTYGPLIAQGAGMVAGAYAGRKATQMAMERSPEEMYGLQGLQGAAGVQGRAGARLLGTGEADTSQARNYYGKLLRGNRALQTQAVAPGIASATDVYRGASRSLDQAGVRGAGRDVANADMARQRASHIAGLTTGVQPMAAEALAQMGSQQTGAGGGLTNQAANIYSNVMGAGTANRKYGRAEGEKTSQAIGQLARDIGETQWGKGKKPGGGTVTVPSDSGWSVMDPSRGGAATTPYRDYIPSTGYTPPTFGGTPAPSPGYTSPVFGTPPKQTPGYTLPTFGGY